MTQIPENHGHEFHEHPAPRERNIADFETADGTSIRIDHLFIAAEDLEPCPNCGGQCVSAGLVGLVLDEVPAVLSPEEALMVANRLTRAANLVLETLEDAPDPEREAVRFGAVPDFPPAD